MKDPPPKIGCLISCCILIILILASCTDADPIMVPEPNDLLQSSVTFEDYNEITLHANLQCPGCHVTVQDYEIFVLDELGELHYQTQGDLSEWSCTDQRTDDWSFVFSSEQILPAGAYTFIIAFDVIENNCPMKESKAVAWHNVRWLL